jgi:anti-anti-sigma regulatory factor
VSDYRIVVQRISPAIAFVSVDRVRTTEAVRDLIHACLRVTKDGASHLLFDFGAARAFRSTLLGYLINLADELRPAKGSVIIVNANGILATHVDLLGLRAFFRFARSRDEAIAMCSRQRRR